MRLMGTLCSRCALSIFSFAAIVWSVYGDSCNLTNILSDKWSFARRPYVYFRFIGVPIKAITQPGSLEMKWYMCIISQFSYGNVVHCGDSTFFRGFHEEFSVCTALADCFALTFAICLLGISTMHAMDFMVSMDWLPILLYNENI